MGGRLVDKYIRTQSSSVAVLTEPKALGRVQEAATEELLSGRLGSVGVRSRLPLAVDL